MAFSFVIRPRIAGRTGWPMLVMCPLIACFGGARSTLRAQAPSHAEANQLHAAIVNGDVESLRYWLTVRHADASAANAAEPGITQCRLDRSRLGQGLARLPRLLLSRLPGQRTSGS
jgi:hypothetical protein